MFKNLLLVGLGGCIGSMMRYLAWYLLRSPNFPLATMLVNITGSLVIGVIIGLSIKDISFSENWKLFLATGICGGFTTFSALSVENLQMLQNGKYLLAFLYTAATIIFGIAAAWLGFKLANN
ncbi:fluoride efflux transporter CrcB [soil metagenome]